MLPLHYTTESYALFNKTDCQGINIRQHNSIIQQPNSNPALHGKRDGRGLHRDELPESSKERWGEGL